MLSCFIIGYGNLGKYLAEKIDKNLKLAGVFDPFVSAPRKKTFNFFRDINSIPIENFTKSDIIILTVNDDAIKNVVDELIHSLPPVDIKGVIHTSGNFSSTAIEPLRAHFSAKIGSFHPYMTFTGKSQPEIPYFWGFEGDQHLISQCEKLAKVCSSKIFKINEKQKKIYHISGVFASNFLISLSRITARLLQKSIQEEENIDNTKAPEILLPLIMQTMSNIRSSSLSSALSGPIKRNDLTTLRSHMLELEEFSPDLAYLYNFFSIELIELLESVGAPVSDDIKRFFEL